MRALFDTCPGGGIGRRTRFRSWRWQHCGGSSPLLGTKVQAKPKILQGFSAFCFSGPASATAAGPALPLPAPPSPFATAAECAPPAVAGHECPRRYWLPASLRGVDDNQDDIQVKEKSRRSDAGFFAQAAKGCRLRMVSSRSGPVETMSMGISHRVWMRSR